MNDGNDRAESLFSKPGTSEVAHKMKIKIVGDYEDSAAKFDQYAAPAEH